MEATAITQQFRQGEVFQAQMRLAEDYLTSSSAAFNEILKGVKAGTAKFKKEVYLEESKSGLPKLYIDDGLFNDTQIFSVNERCTPGSKSLSIEKLEQAARRFNELLSSHKAPEYHSQSAAEVAGAHALVNFALKLPKTEAAQLMQRAEEINQEQARIDKPMLRVSLADLDGDGLPLELKQVDLFVPSRRVLPYSDNPDYKLKTVPIFKVK